MTLPGRPPTRLVVTIIGLALAGTLGGAAQTGVGSATVTGDAAECARAISVQIWSLTRNNFTPQTGPAERFGILTWLSATGGPLNVTLSFVTARTGDGPCRSTFGQLPAGEYVAVIVTPDGSGGSQSFSIAPGAEATVVIPAPVVTLSGQVRRGGEPARTHLRVTSFPYSRPPVVLPTDAEGHYRIVLDRPGLHRIEAVAVGVVEATLTAGPNIVNIPADGGAAPPPRQPDGS